MSETRQQAERARKAFLKLSGGVSGAERTEILREIAQALRSSAEPIYAANAKDLEAAKGSVSEPIYKRLILNEAKLRDVVEGVEQIANMADPVGRVVQETELDDGLLLKKVQ